MNRLMFPLYPGQSFTQIAILVALCIVNGCLREQVYVCACACVYMHVGFYDVYRYYDLVRQVSGILTVSVSA